MLRKPTNLLRNYPRTLFVALLAILFLSVMGVRSMEAQATAVRPNFPPAGLTENQEIRWCHFRHINSYQAKAACITRVAWVGSITDARSAVRVGWCESGLNHTRGIANGASYQGAWQFDSDARSTYRWGPQLVTQVKATVRMLRARHGWGPWPECKPGGIKHGSRWANAPRDVRVYG